MNVSTSWSKGKAPNVLAYIVSVVDRYNHESGRPGVLLVSRVRLVPIKSRDHRPLTSRGCSLVPYHTTFTSNHKVKKTQKKREREALKGIGLFPFREIRFFLFLNWQNWMEAEGWLRREDQIEEASCHQLLKEWIENAGGFIHPQILIASCPGKGRGIYAIQDINVRMELSFEKC